MKTYYEISKTVMAAEPKDRKKVLAQEMRSYKGSDKKLIQAGLSEAIVADQVEFID